MSRYVTRSWLPLYVEPLWDDARQAQPITVSEHQAVDTGLVTPTGEPIMRIPDPMGFHRARGRR